MKIYEFTNAIVKSAVLFFPEIDERNINNCIYCSYTSDNLFILSLTFLLENFNRSGFHERLKKFKLFLTTQELYSLDNLISPKQVDDTHEEVTPNGIEKNNYRIEYFRVPLNIAMSLEK